jgi:hypothetical protein
MKTKFSYRGETRGTNTSLTFSIGDTSQFRQGCRQTNELEYLERVQNLEAVLVSMNYQLME